MHIRTHPKCHEECFPSVRPFVILPEIYRLWENPNSCGAYFSSCSCCLYEFVILRALPALAIPVWDFFVPFRNENKRNKKERVTHKRVSHMYNSFFFSVHCFSRENERFRIDTRKTQIFSTTRDSFFFFFFSFWSHFQKVSLALARDSFVSAFSNIVGWKFSRLDIIQLVIFFLVSSTVQKWHNLQYIVYVRIVYSYKYKSQANIS